MNQPVKIVKRLIKRFQRWLKRYTIGTQNQCLPCDSKSAKLCYVCHILRGKVTGGYVPATDGRPVVVFMSRHKKGNHVIASKQYDGFIFRTNGKTILTTMKQGE